MLDNGKELPRPDGVLINGKGGADVVDFAVEQGDIILSSTLCKKKRESYSYFVVGFKLSRRTLRAGKTYRLRISNVGLQTTLNFQIQGHKMTLVEVEGTHTVQNAYASLDVHVGQSLSVLFTANRPAKDYRIVVSTRFTNATRLLSTAVVRYAGSSGPAPGPLPAGPGDDVDFSLNQARSIRYARE